MADQKFSDMATDTSIGGSETICVNDSGTSKVITTTALFNFIRDQIEAITTAGAIDSGDSFQILQNDNTLKPVTYEIVEDAIAETMYAETDIGALADADVFLVKDGGVTKGTTTASALATYILAEIADSILDISGKTANSTPADTDIILTETGSTPKKTTWAELRSSVLGGLDTYLAALDAAAAGGDTDIIYVTQSGTEKKMTLLQLKTYVGVSVTGTGVANQFARWTSATALKADIGLVASTAGFSSGSDVAVPTTAAVRGELDEIVADSSDIGAALADTDEILIYDDSETAQKRSDISRLYTWLLTQVTAGTVSASEIVVPDSSKDIGDFGTVGVDVLNAATSVNAEAGGTVSVYSSGGTDGRLQIQSEATTSDAIVIVEKEETEENRYVYLYDPGFSPSGGKIRLRTNSTFPRYRLEWIAGQRGKPAANADIQNAAEATRMIADPDFELVGTGAVSGNSSYYAEGGIALTTNALNGNQVILAPHLDASQSAWTGVTWGTDQHLMWECRIRTGANISDAIIWAGLKLTNASAVGTDDDKAFFRYEAGVASGVWQYIYSIGGVDTTVSTGVTAAINTEYHLAIYMTSTRYAYATLNGTEIVGGGQMTDAVDLIPYIGVQTAAAAAKTVYVRSQAIERKFA